LAKAFSSKLAEKSGLPQDWFAEMPQKVDKAEEGLANKLSELSLVEHKKSLFDVHGIAKAVHDKDAPFLEETFAELYEKVQKISNKSAYKCCDLLNSNYVGNPGLCLMCLHSKRFDM
jgi:hypothetical protein